MAEVIERPPSTLESTYKTREVEGLLDLYFYRRVGFQLARFFARIGLTPNGVTALGGLFGLIAGHLYFYRDLRINLVGFALHVWANALDNADGQLARLLNEKSRSGRIIDSLFDHLIFLNIYLHLGLRCWFAGAGFVAVWIVVAAGLSHAVQGAAADYFRNAYLYFVRGRARADWEMSEQLHRDYVDLNWRSDARDKFLLWTYLNFTRQQEFLSPKLRRLRALADHAAENLPASFHQRYAAGMQPMLRGWSLLMTNSRMLVLLVTLVIDRPILYFWMEITVFNVLLLWLLWRQETGASRFASELQQVAIT